MGTSDAAERNAERCGLLRQLHRRDRHVPGSNFTDVRVLESSTLALWDIYRETFDYLYREGQPALLVLAMHCHFGGRPAVAAMFDKILTHIGRHSGVWPATYAEIAQWVRDNRMEADPRRLARD